MIMKLTRESGGLNVFRHGRQGNGRQHEEEARRHQEVVWLEGAAKGPVQAEYQEGRLPKKAAQGILPQWL